MNVSTMEITLIQARMTTGTDASSSSDEFMALLDQVTGAATNGTGPEQTGTSQGSNSTEILLALLQQRSPTTFDSTAISSQGSNSNFGDLLNALSPASTSSTDPTQNNNGAIADLLGQLFHMLDQASSLVSDLYNQLPTDSASSSWPRQSTTSVVDEAKNENSQGQTTTASITNQTAITTDTSSTSSSSTTTGTPQLSQQPLAAAA